MAVWCGQCQTRNEGQPYSCVSCGAALRPAGSGRATAPAIEQRSTGPLRHYDPFRYDSRQLQHLVGGCFPDRGDVAEAAGSCRLALRREVAAAGDGERVYFLPDRPEGYQPEELSCRLGASELRIAIVKDGVDAPSGAVWWIERVFSFEDSPVEARLAQLEQLTRERRVANLLQLLTLAFCVTLALVSLMFLLPTGLSSPAYAPFFLLIAAGVSALARFQSRHLSTLGEIDRLISALAGSLSLASITIGREAGRSAGVWRFAVVVPAATSVLFLWLTIHSLVRPGAAVSVGESLVAVLALAFGYPLVMGFAAVRDWLALRALRAQLAALPATSPL